MHYFFDNNHNVVPLKQVRKEFRTVMGYDDDISDCEFELQFMTLTSVGDYATVLGHFDMMSYKMTTRLHSPKFREYALDFLCGKYTYANKK